MAKVEAEIIRRTNELRKSQGLNPVEEEQKLTKTARDFAQFMADNHKYGHNADGRTPAERATAHGYEYCLVLENIAYQYSSEGFTAEELTKAFQQGWENSPPHRENMLHPHVAQTGVAVVQSRKTGYIYGVQLFGLPRTAQYVFTIKNEAGRTLYYRVDRAAFELPPRYTMKHDRCLPVTLEFTGKAESNEQAAGKDAGIEKEDSPGEEQAAPVLFELEISGTADYIIRAGDDGKLKAETAAK